jgi:hypothetical protein
MGRSKLLSTVAVGVVLVLVTVGSAAAFQALPPGAQVNDDPGAGINGALSVSGEDPANADVVGGALTAGKVAVPWAIFRQTTASGSHDQIFARSFAEGAWSTRGVGTVDGRSSASPTFRGSLNFDQATDGEAPSIDFAGAGRTVPWASWYESTSGTGFGADNVFASRFDNTGDANQGKWIFEGQGRGLGGSSVQVPSLNIHTNRDAENPSVAGGGASAGGTPTQWVTWQETDGSAGTKQIFTSKAVKPVTPPTCPADGVNPAKPASATGAVAAFCWQQVGVERLASAQGSPPNNTVDPSLNVDTTRDGVEPDIAFAGTSDTVPWVVWYEEGVTGTTGPNALHDNEMVFAAKAVAPGSPAPTGTVDGGFDWTVVGSSQQGILDETAGCAASPTSEGNCSLNKTPSQDAEDPRLAAGTMNPANPTVPWVAWDEGPHNGAVKQVFVSRLVGAGTSAHFEVVNGGAPISTGAASSTRPDITFSGNTPYVTWREDVGGGNAKAFTGHFVDAANPTFVLDSGEVSVTPTGQADVREPISSSCTANPFNADGSACQGVTSGTPFFLFTSGTSPLSLFADAYEQSSTVPGSTTTPTPPTTISAPTIGAVAPGPSVVQGTASASKAKASGTGASVRVSCTGASGVSCRLTLKLTVTETFKGHKLVAVSAAARRRTTHKLLVLGTASVTLSAGQSKTVHVVLNGAGKRLLASRHVLKTSLRVGEATSTARVTSVSAQLVTFKAPKKRRAHAAH